MRSLPGHPCSFSFCVFFWGSLPEGAARLENKLEDIDFYILAVGLVLIVSGIAFAVARFIGEARAQSKFRNIVIEARGLRDDDGNSLADTVAKHQKGSVVPILLDLRNRLDGQVIAPERALSEIVSMHRSVLQHQKDGDRADLTTIYGGLTSVPYTFLTGVLLDDEGSIITYDWDRAQETWRKIEGPDDGAQFHVDGVEAIGGAPEVVLATAFSYPIQDDDMATTFDLPKVRLTLDGMSSDGHWSQQKQNRLAQEFLEVAKNLAGKGVKRLHLVLAAPNSVVFTFGRRYDKRNLPEIVVYQYQRGEPIAYPWGVSMPVAGLDQVKVVECSEQGA
ncbi:SAVED domain-containing protein [Yangia mangrovi]|uniref:SAVED domain-containing protein n=1 Tax=Alloyangia mangrovi TaxID=1779329 RepID=A0ABT2KMF2_9RHOB|nr:SAVED domain-containing protein [Alloyangia mangrovi]